MREIMYKQAEPYKNPRVNGFIKTLLFLGWKPSGCLELVNR